MFRWAPYPLIRITIIFCGGILFGIYNPDWINFDTSAIALMAILALSAYFYFRRKESIAFKYLFWMGSLTAISISGWLMVQVKTEANREDHILHLKDSIVAYEAVIHDHFDEKKNSFKTTVSILKVKTQSGWTKARGKINFYFSKSGFPDDLVWGDHILVTGSPLETSPPSNPHEFNYKRFLTFKNIYHQQYVRPEDWVKTGAYDPGLLRFSARIRNYFTGIIKQYVQGKQEQSVSLALIIGVTDGIDNELVSAYSASGAMHVLAVSGLHVGIVYWILLFLLKPFQKDKRGKWIVSLICLGVLWSYAFVTGLSPSVMRAVMMFSFMAIARSVNQRTNIFNTLAGSAFILLILDPYLIMSVGFQLSYLAVLGIIWIQRPLYQMYEPTNRLINWVWNISCVSIAAQATTFSLGLLYFHQFPVYFLFSNLIVIPVATIVLVLGIVLIAVSFINPLAGITGWLLEKFSWLLNWSVFTVEGLPNSIISNIHLDVFQSWLILGVLTSVIFIFQYKNFAWIYVAVTLSLLLLVARWSHFIQRMSSPQLVVYNVSGSTALEVIENGQSFFLTDSLLLTDKERIRFHINGNRLFNLVSHTRTKLVKGKTDSIHQISFRGRSFLLLDHYRKAIPSSVKPDYLIVSRSGAASLPNILNQFPDARVILDGSCSINTVQKLKSKIPVFDQLFSVAERGAFVAEF